MKVLVVRVGEQPQVMDIKDDLKTYQAIVGGYIQCISIDENVDMVCNDEGKIIGLPINRPLVFNNRLVDIICGDFFIVGVDEADFTDLPEHMIKKWKRIYTIL